MIASAECRSVVETYVRKRLSGLSNGGKRTHFEVPLFCASREEPFLEEVLVSAVSHGSDGVCVAERPATVQFECRSIQATVLFVLAHVLCHAIHLEGVIHNAIKFQ